MSQTPVQFFYAATLQIPITNEVGEAVAYQLKNVSGTLDWLAAKDANRYDLWLWFMETRLRELHVPNAIVMFWQCEPNTFPGTANYAT